MKKSKHFKLISLLISLVIIWIITVGCSANENCNTSTTKYNNQNSAAASNIQTNNQNNNPNSTNNTNTQKNNYKNNENTNKSNTSNKNNTNETTINNSKDNNTSAKDKKSSIKITIANKEFDLSVLLNPKDVQNLDNWQLSLLRNAYYAKHGYKFKMGKYSNYFSKYDWYIPKYDDVENFITDSDTKNINLLLELEKTFSQNCIDNIIVNEKNNGENDTFYLGMKMEDALKKLKELKLDSKLKISQINEDNFLCNCHNCKYPQNIIYVEKELYSHTNDKIKLTLKFDVKNHKLFSIKLYSIYPDSISTSLGLKTGDTFENMRTLYGNNYISYGNNRFLPETDINNGIKYCKCTHSCEYKINDYYFRVFFAGNDTVTGWEISKFKIQKRVWIGNKYFCLSCALKPESLKGLDKNDLAKLRNAYYAKYGYIFKTKEYSGYFSGMYDWYTPQYDNVDSLLTETDRKNIDLILKFEKALCEN
ncbi:hypothetical protein CLTEP_19310 [Clostridium tepidiprofundi DSM 19306]|uniref:YARHG domain-containing protein n=1 Tax=Clostridium tepidiprofundi DSM 19306 TaxID=1121338 RepID=A0A151B2L2_9CLOT|nr:YARHG domain-containing protein [Clostridium tepidiprofundi]KYH34154.1 hypothetical protein CLTEP_19310 [Clostridium tepidiprofundi DSM 19306]